MQETSRVINSFLPHIGKFNIHFLILDFENCNYSAHTDQCTYHYPVYVGIMISPWYRTFQHQSSSSTQTLKQPNNLLLDFVCQLNHLAFITWVIFHIFKICFRVKSSEKCHKCLQIQVILSSQKRFHSYALLALFFFKEQS